MCLEVPFQEAVVRACRGADGADEPSRPDGPIRSAGGAPVLVAATAGLQDAGLPVIEPDPLIRPWARRAAGELSAQGGAAAGREGPPVVLVGVHGLRGVAGCPLRAVGRRREGSRSPEAAAAIVVYVLRDPIAAALHALHRCASEVVVLDVSPDGARFATARVPRALARAALTRREIDVLALLLARRTNAEVGAALCLTEATVRSHCRAVLRKLECADRRELWRLPWLAPPRARPAPPPPTRPPGTAAEVCRSFARGGRGPSAT